MIQEINDYYGCVASRMQKCAFCGVEYDSKKEPSKPHAVCWSCWASPGGIADIERESHKQMAIEDDLDKELGIDVLLAKDIKGQMQTVRVMMEELEKELDAYLADPHGPNQPTRIKIKTWMRSLNRFRFSQ